MAAVCVGTFDERAAGAERRRATARAGNATRALSGLRAEGVTLRLVARAGLYGDVVAACYALLYLDLHRENSAVGPTGGGSAKHRIRMI